MKRNPGKSAQKGSCQATPEETTPQPSLRERLRQEPNDFARGNLIDAVIRGALARLNPGCQPQH